MLEASRPLQNAGQEKEDCDDERPVTALPLFRDTMALYGYADGDVIGAESPSGAVLLKRQELPAAAAIFDPAHRSLAEVPEFDLDDCGSTAEFIQKHLDTFTPAVIRGLARQWPAVGKWDLDFFASQCGDIEVEVTLPHGKRRRQALSQYVDDLRPTGEAVKASALPYLRGWYYERDAMWLADDLWVKGDFHDVAFADWFKKFPKRHHPDFHWIFIGAAGATTPLHIDPTATHAWLTQISGRKRFVLFPPCDMEALLRADGDSGSGPFRSLDAIISEGKARALDVVLGPGDTLFVPAYWPHQVECIDESVSVTWNFLGKQLFPLVRAVFLAHTTRRQGGDHDEDG